MSEDDSLHRSRAALQLSRYGSELRISFMYDSDEEAEAARKALDETRQMSGGITITIFDPTIIAQNQDPGKVN